MTLRLRLRLKVWVFDASSVIVRLWLRHPVVFRWIGGIMAALLLWMLLILMLATIRSQTNLDPRSLVVAVLALMASILLVLLAFEPFLSAEMRFQHQARLAAWVRHHGWEDAAIRNGACPRLLGYLIFRMLEPAVAARAASRRLELYTRKPHSDLDVQSLSPRL